MSPGDRAVAEARRWLGTPYRHQADLIGLGTDCAMILVRVYQSAGLLPLDIDPRPYPTDWHLHRSEERYLGWVERFAEPVESPKPGDVALFKFGRCLSHGGIVDAVSPEITMIHADLVAGVERTEVRRWADRLAGFWRMKP
ncbi:MAG: hydrolase [Elusimicrobia bacterium]|nr:hydrolase [Elusimicrobiota bacterium]